MTRLSCNIDRRGRRLRAVSGTVALALAGATAWFGVPGIGAGWVRWTVVALLVLMGGFQWFEARRGWCIVRAMGIRTPI